MLTRISSGCVIFRNTRKGNVEFLLVTSSNGKSWVLPKGGVEFGMTPRESAAKECLEEAGVLVNVGAKLGEYRYARNGILNQVTMYVALYVEDAKEWPEENKRERKWCKLDKALEKVDQYLGAFLVDVAGMVEANEIHENAKS